MPFRSLEEQASLWRDRGRRFAIVYTGRHVVREQDASAHVASLVDCQALKYIAVHKLPGEGWFQPQVHR
jgi:hypothetical protein